MRVLAGFVLSGCILYVFVGTTSALERVGQILGGAILVPLVLMLAMGMTFSFARLLDRQNIGTIAADFKYSLAIWILGFAIYVPITLWLVSIYGE